MVCTMKIQNPLPMCTPQKYKIPFPFNGVHHKNDFKLQWCIHHEISKSPSMVYPTKLQNPLPWCTPQKPFLASMVYTPRNCKLPLYGVHHETILSFHGVYTTKFQNPLPWCTSWKFQIPFHGVLARPMMHYEAKNKIPPLFKSFLFIHKKRFSKKKKNFLAGTGRPEVIFFAL